MNQQIATPSVSLQASPIPNAANIAELRREEVIPLAREEFNRFLGLVESLSPADWHKPTECTLWSVKDIVAHQASHVLGLTSALELLNQFNPFTFLPYLQKGMNLLDASNQKQVEKRAHWTTAQLITEMRDNSEKSFLERQRFPAILRWTQSPVPGTKLWINTGKLIDNIFTRDMWMHRLDICHSTGREMIQTAAHDGRITALAMLDLAQNLGNQLKNRAVIYHLTGKAGGEWLIGSASAEARLTLDVLAFHRIAAGRITSQTALESSLVEIEGDETLGKLALRNTSVLY